MLQAGDVFIKGRAERSLSIIMTSLGMMSGLGAPVISQTGQMRHEQMK
jgi:hypothetical protein